MNQSERIFSYCQRTRIIPNRFEIVLVAQELQNTEPEGGRNGEKQQGVGAGMALPAPQRFRTRNADGSDRLFQTEYLKVNSPIGFLEGLVQRGEAQERLKKDSLRGKNHRAG